MVQLNTTTVLWLDCLKNKTSKRERIKRRSSTVEQAEARKWNAYKLRDLVNHVIPCTPSMLYFNDFFFCKLCALFQLFIIHFSFFVCGSLLTCLLATEMLSTIIDIRLLVYINNVKEIGKGLHGYLHSKYSFDSTLYACQVHLVWRFIENISNSISSNVS